MSEINRSNLGVDRFVGARIRERRTMLGLTQYELARQIGVTHQQLHKYETAINRISAASLFRCAQALRAPIDFFFSGLSEDPAVSVPESTRHRLALEFSRTFNEIADPEHQRAVAEMARVLARPTD